MTTTKEETVSWFSSFQSTALLILSPSRSSELLSVFRGAICYLYLYGTHERYRNVPIPEAVFVISDEINVGHDQLAKFYINSLDTAQVVSMLLKLSKGLKLEPIDFVGVNKINPRKNKSSKTNDVYFGHGDVVETHQQYAERKAKGESAKKAGYFGSNWGAGGSENRVYDHTVCSFIPLLLFLRCC
jgi:hypothetical protein